MNTLNRFLYGLAASLLLLAGFTRAAERLDPLTAQVGDHLKPPHVAARNPCSLPCFDDWGDEDDDQE